MGIEGGSGGVGREAGKEGVFKNSFLTSEKKKIK